MDPFLGEIRLFSFSLIPRGWLPCNGQLLPIAQNNALFSLLGIAYGGDGLRTFGLPDLRGRVPIHMNLAPNPEIPLGTAAGQESVTLTAATMPAHNHPALAYSTAGNSGALANNLPAQSTAPSATAPAAPNVYDASGSGFIAIDPSSVASTGAASPHENRQPSIAMNYCIAAQGVWPSRS